VDRRGTGDWTNIYTFQRIVAAGQQKPGREETLGGAKASITAPKPKNKQKWAPLLRDQHEKREENHPQEVGGKVQGYWLPEERR